MSDEVGQLKQELEIQKNIAYTAGLLQGDITIRTLFESLAEGVVVINPLGRIILINPRMETMFGYSRAEVQGEPIDIYIPPELRESHHGHISEFFTRPRIRPMGMGLDLSGCRKDGSTFPIEVSVSFLDAEHGTLGLAFISDISARKETEEQLKQTNKHLDEFAQIVAHDLNSNVTSIVSVSEMLNDPEDDFSDEERKEFLNEISRIGTKMSDIIKELLLFARMDRTDLTVSPVDMNPLIQSAIQRLKGDIADTGAVVKTDPMAEQALGYAPWVEEVWFNYLSNALKYGGRPPQIEIGCSREDGIISFWVKDNGPGIDADKMHLLFDDQNDAREKIIKGHGLGLSIVNNIVERMGGSVHAESRPGEGSTFYFRLPAV
ncbi:PAS domain S-box protein [Pontiella sp.]|uniref:sensor histidine kinase n=1 Tax=Pontiella sp. TaxID=2837462 RepID=UPI0035642BB1